MVGHSLDVDIDENGELVEDGEPKVSAKTGKRRNGKPRALTDAKIDRICDLIRKGNYIKQSCLSCSVNYNTFHCAMNKGKKGIKPYDKWYEKIEIAKADAETGIVNMLADQIEKGNVGVAQWMLARKFPQRWERSQKQEVKIDNTQKLEIVKFSDLSKENKE